ncbi:hypothetical protein M8C21_006407, partial [Ambrosia artemisiifolia]
DGEQDSETLLRMLPKIPSWVKNPDVDRVDWLNTFIEYMWPYLDKAICKTAKEIIKPIIAEQIRKFKIYAVVFEMLTLGSLPPTFQGTCIYPDLYFSKEVQVPKGLCLRCDYAQETIDHVLISCIVAKPICWMIGVWLKTSALVSCNSVKETLNLFHDLQLLKKQKR